MSRRFERQGWPERTRANGVPYAFIAWFAPLWAGLIAISLQPGCSLRTVSQNSCETHAECRLVFGFGSTCGEDGFCDAQSEPYERCATTYPEDLLTPSDSDQEPIVFGALFDASNPTHVARQRSAQLAILQVNDEGGVEGRPFGIVFCDLDPDAASDGSENTGDAAIASTTYLTQDLGIQVLLGPSSSGDVERVFNELREQDVFLISPSATSPSLSILDVVSPTDERPGTLWRTAPPDSLQGARIAQYLDSCGAMMVDIIADDGPYGSGLVPEMTGLFSGSQRTGFYSSENRRSELIQRAGNSEFGTVLFVSSEQEAVIDFLNAANTINGYDDKLIFLTDTAATENTLSQGPSRLFENIRGTRPQLPTTDRVPYATFLASFSSRFEENPERFSFTANSYDMTWVAMLGSAWAVLAEGELSGTAVAKGARRLSAAEEDPTDLVPSSWLPLVEQLKQGQSVNISGASGELDYEPDTEETSTPIEVWAIQPSERDPDVPAFAVVEDGDCRQGSN